MLSGIASPPEGYTILNEIGRGGTACVYLAKRVTNGEHFAVKIFHPHLLSERPLSPNSFQKRIKNEFAALQSLDHPNIVRAHAMLPEENPNSIIFEYIDGLPLQDFQKLISPMAPEAAMVVAVEVLKALEAAHAKGIIHRDLKPSNILLPNSGDLKVTDFGLAKFLEGHDFTHSASTTVAGGVLGSPEFMSPEQARGEAATIESDLFSLGCILYLLVEGHSPFRRHSALSTIQAVADDDPAPITSNYLEPEFKEIIFKSLNKARADRFRSAKEMQNALYAALDRYHLTGEAFQLKSIVEDSDLFVFNVLRAKSKALEALIQNSISKQNNSEAHIFISRLALISPHHEKIAELSNKAEKCSRTRNLKRRASLLLSLIGTIFIFSGDHFIKLKTGPVDAVSISQSIPVAAPIVPAVRAPAPEKLLAANVYFTLSPGMVAEIAGKRVAGSKKIYVKPGEHTLVLKQNGKIIANQTISVNKTEPTRINTIPRNSQP